MDVLRKLFKPRLKDSISLIAERFLLVFAANNIEKSHIPRLIPKIKYEDLSSPNQLLAALTPEVIDTTAKLFGVQSQWLEGVDETVYESFWLHKNPGEFLSYFASAFALGNSNVWFPLRVLTTSAHLDRHSADEQLLLPVIVETLTRFGDDPIYRCRLCSMQFDWADPRSRIELKAIALLVYRRLRTPIPLFTVTPQEMECLTDGSSIPSVALRRVVITNPSLEDYVMTSEQSWVAKETDELPAVLSYLEAEGLNQSVFEIIAAVGLDDSPAETPPVSSLEVTAASDKKPGLGKRQCQKNKWAAIVGAAQTIWAQEPTVTYTAMIQRLQQMHHLKASALGESAIRKHIRAVAPPEVRGKPGRRPKEST